MKRCRWADPNLELYIAYHDNEWGRPEHDDRKLFEMLTLEGFQAGLSWLMILKKREAFRRAFDNFQPDVIVQYGPEKVEALMADAGIVRNRRKIEAAIRNAGVYLSIPVSYTHLTLPTNSPGCASLSRRSLAPLTATFGLSQAGKSS